MVLPKLKRHLNAKNTLSDHDSVHEHRNSERSAIARHRNFNAPKICKITVVGWVSQMRSSGLMLLRQHLFGVRYILPCSHSCLPLGGSEKERKGGRNGRTIACDVCLSPGPRAAWALEPSHAHYAHWPWRLNGEHSNAHTVDLDHDDDPRRNEQTTTCRSCRKVLS